MSADKPPVHEAWAAVMGDVQAVAKGDKSSHGNFSFRGVDAVVNAVGPALRRHGVIVVPARMAPQLRDVTTGNGKHAQECVLEIDYRIVGPAGDELTVQVAAESIDYGDKAIAQAASVALRTLYLQSLTIPTGDVDPDHTVHERTAAPPPAPKRIEGYGPDGGAWLSARRYLDLLPDDVQAKVAEYLADNLVELDNLPDDGWRKNIADRLVAAAQKYGVEPFEVDKPAEPESYPPGQEPFDTPEEAA